MLTFKIGPFPVNVQMSFWIVMGLFGMSVATGRNGLDVAAMAGWVVLAFIGILTHEVGHAFFFKTFGTNPSITMHGMGGVTTAAGNLKPWQKLVTTLAGPAMGLIVGGIAVFVGSAGVLPLGAWNGLDSTTLFRTSVLPAPGLPLPQQLFSYFIFINIGWALFNLVPLYPMDGGQALESSLEVLHVPYATQVTSALGVAIGAAGGFFALRAGSLYMLLVFGLFVFANLRRLFTRQKTVRSIHDQPIPPHLSRSVDVVQTSLSQGRDSDAAEAARQEFELRPTPHSANLYTAVLIRAQNWRTLSTLLRSPNVANAPEALTNGAAALVSAGWASEGLDAAERAWSASGHRSVDAAVTAAAAHSINGATSAAFEWLTAARSLGWNDRARFDSDPSFAALRSDPRATNLFR